MAEQEMSNSGSGDEASQTGGMTRDERIHGDRGVPGEGAGRRDEVGHTGVYPFSARAGASGSAPLIGEQEWGQGVRGRAGYEDSGDSEPSNLGPSTPSEAPTEE